MGKGITSILTLGENASAFNPVFGGVGNPVASPLSRLLGGSGPPSPLDDVVIATERFVAPVSTGTVSWTTAKTSKTPKAAIFEFVRARIDGASASGSSMMRGFWAANGGDRSITWAMEDATTVNTNTNYAIRSADLQGRDWDNTVINWVTSITAKAGGFDVTFNTVSANAWYWKVTMFFGDDLQAHSGALNLPGLNLTSSVTAPGFRPSVVFTNLFRSGGDAISTGVLIDDSDKQHCVGWRSEDGVGTSNLQQVLRTNRMASLVDLGDPQAEGAITASGFDVTSRNSSGSPTLQYLALSTGNRKVALGTYAFPGSTGLANITGIPFKPQAGLFTGTKIASGQEDILKSNAEAEAYTSYEFDSSLGGNSFSLHETDGVATHVAKSASKSNEYQLWTTGAIGQATRALLNSINGDGITWNVAAAPSGLTLLSMYVFIE